MNYLQTLLREIKVKLLLFPATCVRPPYIVFCFPQIAEDFLQLYFLKNKTVCNKNKVLLGGNRLVLNKTLFTIAII